MPDLDQSANYNTPLRPEQEAAFQQWREALAANPKTRNLANTNDYDLRGAWLKGAKEAGNGHLPDDWKKPNHPTFSRESIYSGPYATGGDWTEQPDHKWQFSATPDNLRYRDANALRGYFEQVEPQSRLVLPNALTGR